MSMPEKIPQQPPPLTGDAETLAEKLGLSPEEIITMEVNKAPEVIAQRKDEEILKSKMRMKLLEAGCETLDDAVKMKIEASNSLRTLELAKADLIKREGEFDAKVKAFQPIIDGLTSREIAVSAQESSWRERKGLIDAEISDRESRLTELSSQISAEQDRLIKEIKRWLGVLNEDTTRSRHLADKSTGPMGQKYIAQENKGLDYMESLKNLWKRIGG